MVPTFAALSALALLALVLGRRFRLEAMGGLALPLALLAVGAAAEAAALHFGLHGTSFERGAELVVYSLLAYLLGKGALALFFSWILERRVGVRIPLLARELISLLVYLLLAAIVARLTLGIEVGALLTTSAVITVILGLALQQTLGALLGGIVLILEGKLNAGQWIRVGPILGRIEELGWRSLMVRTPLDEVILIPNSLVTGDRVTLLGDRISPVGLAFPLEVGYETAPDEVAEVLVPLIADHPEVVSPPAPQVLPIAFMERGVRYEVRFWTFSPGRDIPLRAEILSRFYRAAQRHRMSLPELTARLSLREESGREQDRSRVLDALQRSDIFGGLPQAALERLLAGAPLLDFAPGEVLIREGATCSLMYVIVWGEVEVTQGIGAERRVVAVVKDGDEVGELAFLTGRARVATVRACGRVRVLEIGVETLRRVLEEFPEVGQHLARQGAARELLLRRSAPEEPSPDEDMQGSILERLRRMVGR